jgi:hypothetical protein
MWDFVRSLLGDLTFNELALVVLIFASVLLFSWAPRIGEAVGAAFDADDEPPA